MGRHFLVVVFLTPFISQNLVYAETLAVWIIERYGKWVMSKPC